MKVDIQLEAHTDDMSGRLYGGWTALITLWSVRGNRQFTVTGTTKKELLKELGKYL